MAIIINNKNLYRRVINGQDVQKVVLNGKEIRPTGGNIDYHVVSNWGTSGGGTGVPGGWDTSGTTIIDDNYVSNGGSGNPSKLIYNGMPSLLNAFKVEIIYKLYRTQESAEKPFSSGLTHRTSNTYLSEITQSSGWTRSFLAGNESDNDILTGATAGEYTITSVLDLENSIATQTIAGPNDFEQELELTLDATDIYNIRHSDAFGIELNDGMRLYRVDFFVYNTPQNPQIGPGIYHNATLGLISLSLDGENWITIADKDLGATEVYGQGLLYQRGNNHGFPSSGDISFSDTRIDASNYGPGNYYDSSTFIRTNGEGWDTSNNTNLWGGDDDTALSKQGPCPDGYHIAAKSEINAIKNILSGLIPPREEPIINNYLLIGHSMIIDYDGSRDVPPSGTSYWTWLSNSTEYCFSTGFVLGTSSEVSSYGFSIRPFKNASVVPDNTWTVLLQPS